MFIKGKFTELKVLKGLLIILVLTIVGCKKITKSEESICFVKENIADSLFVGNDYVNGLDINQKPIKILDGTTWKEFEEDTIVGDKYLKYCYYKSLNDEDLVGPFVVKDKILSGPPFNSDSDIENADTLWYFSNYRAKIIYRNINKEQSDTLIILRNNIAQRIRFDSISDFGYWDLGPISLERISGDTIWFDGYICESDTDYDIRFKYQITSDSVRLLIGSIDYVEEKVWEDD